MSEDQALPLWVAIRFTHAAVQVMADQERLDVLHVKGPAVDASLLERRLLGDEDGSRTQVVARQSVDADVLVRPSHVARMIDAMHAHNWVTEIGFEDDSAFGHAMTLMHPKLGYLDLHRRFPGIRREPEYAFDLLWADRNRGEIAGHQCWVPCVQAQRLLLILHAVRGGANDTHPDLRRSWTDASPEERAEVERLARLLKAEVPLAAGTGRLEDFRGRREYELWRLLSTGASHTLLHLWAARVRAEPSVLQAARTGVNLILPKPQRIRLVAGRPPTTREVLASYAGRARLGFQEVGRAIRVRCPMRNL